MGYYSTALGGGNTATGDYSTALGGATTASGNLSTALGGSNTASGELSTAMGGFTLANGGYATALGNSTIATGYSATAMGYAGVATGNYSTAMGYNTRVSSVNATAMGINNIDSPNALLIVGNGLFDSERSNALTLFSDGKMVLGNATPQQRLHVVGGGYFSGSVGIGVTNPIAPLHIGSSSSVNETNTRYFSYGTGGTIPVLANGAYNVGLLVEADIVTKNSFVSAQTATTSDAHLKTITGISNSQKDLYTLQQLKITDYYYKDVAVWGKQPFKKVIAQQVEEVYPQAVRKTKAVIPDIYVLAERVEWDEAKKELTVTLPGEYGLKAGDRLELADGNQGKIQAKIVRVSGNDFTVGNWPVSTDKIFVIGREVDDLRVVDYEAISMLGISAIQHLAKENEELGKEIKLLKTNNDRINTKLEAIEALLVKFQFGKQ